MPSIIMLVGISGYPRIASTTYTFQSLKRALKGPRKSLKRALIGISGYPRIACTTSLDMRRKSPAAESWKKPYWSDRIGSSSASSAPHAARRQRPCTCATLSGCCSVDSAFAATNLASGHVYTSTRTLCLMPDALCLMPRLTRHFAATNLA